MYSFRRVFISVKRNSGKSILLLLIVAGLGTLMSGAIVLSQSINQTRDNLWRQLPPAVVIDRDRDAVIESMEAGIFDWEADVSLTKDVLDSIISLSYVRTFDIFNGTTIYSRELERVLLEFSIDQDQESFEGYPVVMMDLRGITNPSVLDIEMGLDELVLGRAFTAAEMNPTNPHESVAMISRRLADLNGLEVGDSIILENNFYKHSLLDYQHYWGRHPDDHIIDYEIYTLEIIGLFEPVVVPDFASDMQEVFANNAVIVPLPVVHSVMDFTIGHWQQDYIDHGIAIELEEAAETPQSNIILLHDAADLPHFIDAAAELLPPYYMVGTFSNSVLAIERLDESMNFFQDLSVQALWIVTGVTILALSLVILLFLRDRKNEIGIYLALGEKKASIAKQIFFETLLPSIGGIILALFLGNLIAGFIGHEMLVNEIIAGQNFNLDDYGWSNAGAQFQWFMEGQIDTLIENYDVTLDGRAIALFWTVSMATVFVATIFPIIYLMRLNPKEILMLSQER